jgi:hypothetical protein
MSRIVALTCRSEYRYVLDILKRIIKDVEIIENINTLDDIQDIEMLLNFDCKLNYEKLFKLNTNFKIINICSIIDRNTIEKNLISSSTLIYIQPIVGTIRVIKSRIKSLFDTINAIKIMVKCDVLDDNTLLCEDNSTNKNLSSIKNSLKDLDTGKIDITCINGNSIIKIMAEGMQFNKKKKISYNIIYKNDINHFIAIEIYSCIKLIIDRVVGNGILMPEDIGRDEGTFAYYISNLIADQLKIRIIYKEKR